jgi:GntR family transcriptional regulator, arabinose operon transcriptional repressor
MHSNNNTAMKSDENSPSYKNKQIYEDMRRRILGGEFSNGLRLPTASRLAIDYEVSRPTATKALNELRKNGLVIQGSGAGYYAAPATGEREGTKVFGLLIPGLGSGEIFEPITRQIASRSEQDDFSLLWIGSQVSPEGSLSALEYAARRYAESRTSGVFFAPIELGPTITESNELVISILSEAKIPIVLIDTDYLPFPERSPYDLVSIDHHRGAYLLTQHFLDHGLERIDFLARPYSASTISVRMLGYRAALFDHGIVGQKDWIHIGNPSDPDFVLSELLMKGATDIICGNDDTAVALIHTLDRLSIDIPEEVRVIGFDDVRYAQHLSVPLTTLKQPCAELGDLAIDTMLSRLANPELPPRTVTLQGSLVIRKSCGCL